MKAQHASIVLSLFLLLTLTTQSVKSTATSTTQIDSALFPSYIIEINSVFLLNIYSMKITAKCVSSSCSWKLVTQSEKENYQFRRKQFDTLTSINSLFSIGNQPQTLTASVDPTSSFEMKYGSTLYLIIHRDDGKTVLDSTRVIGALELTGQSGRLNPAGFILKVWLSILGGMGVFICVAVITIVCCIVCCIKCASNHSHHQETRKLISPQVQMPQPQVYHPQPQPRIVQPVQPVAPYQVYSYNSQAQQSQPIQDYYPIPAYNPNYNGV